MPRVALTTTDNPNNPIDDFIAWSNFDHQKGYYTAEYLANYMEGRISSDWSLEDQEDAKAECIDEIVNEAILRDENDKPLRIKFVEPD